MSEDKKKRVAWNRGKKLSIEERKKISISHIGLRYPNRKSPPPMSKETRYKMGLVHKGNKYNLGRKQSNEEKRKRVKSRSWYKVTQEHKDKIGLANSKIPHLKGNKHYNWQGGKSFEIYTIDWTNTLKQSIRERDKYICQLCNEKQGDKAYCVHHIDYDKKNCNPDNFITLCRKCHTKTNHNRDYWINYFNNI